MDLSQKYNLIELLPGEGVQSYTARQINTGRDVTVHLLMDEKTQAKAGFLVRLRTMQPQSMAKLIEVGEYQGAMFVVTVAPPYQRLDEWLAEQDRAEAAAKEFGKAGIWKRPEVSKLAPASTQPTKGPEANEFTKPFLSPTPSSVTAQFQTAGAQTPAAPDAERDDFAELFSRPAGETSSRPDSQLPSAATWSSEPGEFTRMFQSAAAPTLEPVAPPAAATKVTPLAPLARPPVTPSTEPGEFTQMFQNSAAPPPEPFVPPPAVAKVMPAPPPAQSSEPGEFTRLFQTAPPPEPVAPPPAVATKATLAPPPA
jgi:hypothetical protein